MERKKFPKAVETKVLLASRRRCAFCFGFDGDTTEKEGQLAHVDRDRSNVRLENAAFLCTRHHARYDSWSRQTKQHTPDELCAYRGRLYAYLESDPGAWPGTKSRLHGPKGRAGLVSLEVHDRRVPFYRITRQFVREIVAEGKVDLSRILKFAADTDEVLFLFDDSLATYLSQIYGKAIRFHFVTKMLERPNRNMNALMDEDSELLLWFSEQLEEMRRRFLPFLRIS